MADKLHIKGVPPTVAEIVTLICQDYRMRRAKDALPADYGFTSVIQSALGVCETGIADAILEDICLRRGYWCSPINYLISKNAYYERKRAVVRSIAIGLHLI